MGFDLLFSAMMAMQSWRLIHPRLRPYVLKAAGLHVARRNAICSGVYFGSRKITIADECFVSVGCFLDGSDAIVIGQSTYLGPQVRILTSFHEIGPHRGRAGPLRCAPVAIRAGCWLGAGVTVLPGVTVAEGCVVGAGSLVPRSTEPDGLYVGTPARRIRDLPT